MSKISRVFQNLYGSSGSSTKFGQPGSINTTKTNTKDPSVIQSLSAFLLGLEGIILSGSYKIALEDLNSLFLLTFYQIAYLFQAGIPEYDGSTIYYTNSRCQQAGVVYVSLQDNNTGNAPGGATSAYWQAVGDIQGADIASASSIQPGSDGTIFNVTGTTTINTITNTNSIKKVTLIFTGALTVTSSGNISLNGGNFLTASGYTLSLVWNGSAWKEVSRSPNISGNPLSGWTKLANGLIIQWGQTGAGGNPTTITFPIPFPTGCVSVTATNTTSGFPTQWVSVGNFSTSGFQIFAGQPSGTAPTVAASWIAIGY